MSEPPRYPFFQECGSRPSASHRCRLHTLARWDGQRASAFRGVHLRKPRRGNGPVRWRAAVVDTRVNRGKTVHLGTFVHEGHAAAAYDLALIALGDAPVNEPLAFYAAIEPRSRLLSALRKVSLNVTLEGFPNRFTRHDLAEALAPDHQAHRP